MRSAGRYLLVGSVAIGLMAAAALAAERVAVVDAARVVKEYKKTKLADARMEEQVAEFTAEGDKMLAEYGRLKKDFEAARTESQSKALSEKAIGEKKDRAEDKLLKMVELEKKIRETAGARKRQLEEQRLRMHQRLVEEITQAIAQLAAKEGYSLVLDSSGMTTSGFREVIHSASNLDITTTVIGLLNQETPSTAK
jgi:outer membrane protein